MYDWIIEADIYRLSKALEEEASAEKRETLRHQLSTNRAQLRASQPKPVFRIS